MAALIAAATSIFLLYRRRHKMNSSMAVPSLRRSREEVIPRSEEERRTEPLASVEDHGYLFNPCERPDYLKVASSLMSGLDRKSYMDPEPTRSSWVESGACPTSSAQDLGQAPEIKGYGHAGVIASRQGSPQFAGAPSVPIHEEDAGPVLDRLPPVYDPRWGDSRDSVAV